MALIVLCSLLTWQPKLECNMAQNFSFMLLQGPAQGVFGSMDVGIRLYASCSDRGTYTYEYITDFYLFKFTNRP